VISLGISNEITTSFRNTYKIGRFGTLKKLAIFAHETAQKWIFLHLKQCKNMPSYANAIRQTQRPD
jgi:hypothetical protein